MIEPEAMAQPELMLQMIRTGLPARTRSTAQIELMARSMQTDSMAKTELLRRLRLGSGHNLRTNWREPAKLCSLSRVEVSTLSLPQLASKVYHILLLN
jgi:hypothetical protein